MGEKINKIKFINSHSLHGACCHFMSRLNKYEQSICSFRDKKLLKLSLPNARKAFLRLKLVDEVLCVCLMHTKTMCDTFQQQKIGCLTKESKLDVSWFRCMRFHCHQSKSELLCALLILLELFFSNKYWRQRLTCQGFFANFTNPHEKFKATTNMHR